MNELKGHSKSLSVFSFCRMIIKSGVAWNFVGHLKTNQAVSSVQPDCVKRVNNKLSIFIMLLTAIFQDYVQKASAFRHGGQCSALFSKMRRYARNMVAFILVGAAAGSSNAFAARISDITHTKHNLSINGPGNVRAYAGTQQNQVCVFCHTPHGATIGVNPLWNRKISSAVYTTYTSASLDAETIQGTLSQPGGSSKLCLSCHDGTLAIGNVNVMWGKGATDTQLVTTPSEWQMIMLGTNNYDPNTFLGGQMPFGGAGAISDVASAVLTGYTRNLGIDLRNDHPISVNYTQALAARDGELRNVDNTVAQKSLIDGIYGLGSIIGKRSSGYRPMNPLEGAGSNKQGVGQIQCATCHDPHLRETNPLVGNQKFLRQNRFQEAAPNAGYNDVTDIGCVACHDKNGGRAGPGAWAYSVHSNPLVSTPPQTYKFNAAKTNEFPTTDDRGVANGNLPMWQASCLNCHDNHTVQGARWLLREGTDSTSIPKAGGNSAIEETCYLCHTDTAASVIENGNAAVNIKTEFALARHMPITLADQQANAASPGSPAAEVHDIGGLFNDGTTENNCSYPIGTNKCGSDFMESRAKLGVGNLANRHAECSDCHNPHRMVKSQSFLGNAGLLSTPDAVGTHKHGDASLVTDPLMKHTNIASGALRGTFGVEPTYAGASFTSLPSGYTAKRGDPADTLGVADCANMNRLVCNGKLYVTREYQICLKCHSDYGYTDNNIWPYSGLPQLPATGANGLTPAGTNGLSNYTNQAREFQAPSADRGALSSGTSGAGALYQINNQRSWHPVMDSTGRDSLIVRGNNLVDIKGAFNLPWSNDVGNQTMYCSDCHGSGSTANAASVIPNGPWGPHGSNNNFVLKGTWDGATGSGATKATTTDLCFKCHDYNTYALGVAAAAAAGAGRSGFFMGGEPAGPTQADGHQLHVDRIGAANGGKGTRCDWCHVAVPHGWKNKGLLVNLNDVGSEAGQAAGTEVQVLAASGVGYTSAPYYLNARLKVINFKPSGQWAAADCGSRGTAPGTGNGQAGLAWMKTSNENCMTPP